MFAYTRPLPQPDVTSDHSCSYARVMFTQIVHVHQVTSSEFKLIYHRTFRHIPCLNRQIVFYSNISLPHVMTELHDPSPHNTHAAGHALPKERTVECKGLQSITKIWVFNSQVCTDGSGNIIDPYHSPYIWVSQFC